MWQVDLLIVLLKIRWLNNQDCNNKKNRENIWKLLILFGSCSSLSIDGLKFFFLSVLKTKLEKSVRIHKPQSLQEAVHLARLQGRHFKRFRKENVAKKCGQY